MPCWVSDSCAPTPTALRINAARFTHSSTAHASYTHSTITPELCMHLRAHFACTAHACIRMHLVRSAHTHRGNVCCFFCVRSNTLELPDYADALMATQPDLKQEWALSQKAGDGHGCPKLVQACCRVLDEKLKVCITSAGESVHALTWLLALLVSASAAPLRSGMR